MTEWQTVPIYPTNQMERAYLERSLDASHDHDCTDHTGFYAGYAAMLEAAPTPDDELAQKLHPFIAALKRTAEIIECNDPGHSGNAVMLLNLAEIISAAQQQGPSQ